jgi:hypothetical protein
LECFRIPSLIIDYRAKYKANFAYPIAIP